MSEENKDTNEAVEEAAPESAEETKEEAPAEAPAEEAKEDAPAETADDSADEGAEVEVPEEFKALVEQIEKMTVLELNSLVKVLEKKFGVSAVAVAAGPAAGDAGAGAEEKDSFTVELASAGDSKIAVIKAVKAALGLGLKEAKDLVDGAPVVLKEDMKKEEAEELQKAVAEAGGSINLK